MKFRSALLFLGCVPLWLACSDPSEPPPGASVAIEGAPALVDTVGAYRSVEVTVRGEDGEPAAGVLVVLVVEGGYFTDDPSVNGGWTRLELESDAAGRVETNLLLGHETGPATVRAIAASLEDELQIDKQPGALARLLTVPAETALAVGAQYTMGVSAGDRHGNPRSDAVSAPVRLSLRTAVASVNGSVVTALAPGRATIRLEALGIVDSTQVNVVPPGRLAVFDTVLTGATAGALLDIESESVVDLAGVDRSDCPAWHPDGSRLLLRGLRLHTPGGATTELLPADSDLDAQCGQFTADAAWIFFEVARSTNAHQIWRMRADGSGLEQLTPDDDTRDAHSPSPSPDGARFAYVLRGPRWDRRFILVRDVATGAVDTISPLLQDPQSSSIPPSIVAWSPTGEWIAYTSTGEQVFFSVRSWTWGSHIHLVRPDGTGMHRVTGADGTPRNFRNGQFSWSPDGRWLAAKLQYYDLRLSLIDVETGDVLPLNGHTGAYAQPLWRPE